MPKDYQEIERIVEELKAWGWGTEGGKEAFTHAQMNQIRQALTTYGNAQVEEIIKIIESLKIEGVNRFDGDKTQDVRDYLNDWLMLEIKRNLIKAIKKEWDKQAHDQSETWEVGADDFERQG